MTEEDNGGGEGNEKEGLIYRGVYTLGACPQNSRIKAPRRSNELSINCTVTDINLYAASLPITPNMLHFF